MYKKCSVPVRVVHLGLGAQQRLLARLVRVVSPDLVAVFLGLEERDEVDARPHLFSCELTI